MKSRKINSLFLIPGLFFWNGVKAQKASVLTETYSVSGNCGMCKKTIETAASVKGVKSAEWNEHAKVLKVKYDREKTTADAVLRNVAYAGYDNERYLAPGPAYEKLHACCHYERRINSETAMNGEGRQTATAAAGLQHVQKDESPLSNVYSRYFTLKDALVKSDPMAASQAASHLLDEMDKVNMGAMSGAAHDNYMKASARIVAETREIKSGRNIEKQRQAFSRLSDLLYTQMKAMPPAYEVYLDHCPMYNDGKGANWISREQIIRNPYYGSKMMTCGRIEESLKK